MILDSGENHVRSVLWHFLCFSQLLGQSCTSAVCPRSFLCAWCQNLHWRGLVVVMTLDGLVMVAPSIRVFSFFFVFFRGGSNTVAVRAKVDGKWQAKFQRHLRYRATGFRPSGLPNLPFSLFLSFPPLSSTSLSFSIFSPFFPLFTLFPPPFFFSFFLHFSNNFPSPSHVPLFPAFSGQSDASPCDHCVSNVPHKAQDTETNATCCGRGFCIFLGIFRHIQKRVPIA